MLKKSALFFLILSILVFSSSAYADPREMEMTTYYPAPYGEYQTLSSTHATNLATSVGSKAVIGTLGADDQMIKLELPQNTAIKLGDAYFSSGTGDSYAHLATNQWWSGSVGTGGSGWITTGAGALIQIVGQAINFYTHTAAGAHTASLQIDATNNITIPSGSLTVSGGMTRPQSGLVLPSGPNATNVDGEIWIV